MMEQAGVNYVEGDEERYYRVLTGNEENAVAREQIRRQLNRSGVDVNSMLDSVPSYQTIRHHLQQCEGLDTSGEKSHEVTPEAISETVRAAEKRVECVAERSVGQLNIDSSHSVNTSTIVRCEKCGSVVDLHDFLDGGCKCMQHL
jgi:hypothetical protein